MSHKAPTAAESVALAALVFEVVAGATEAHLLPPGPFRAVDGRPHDVEAWQLDAAIAARVIARQAARSNDTLIDFEHQSLRAADNGKRVEAAGWFRDLEWRDGRGLYATSIRWVGDTAQLIEDRKVRYVSAVFIYHSSTGEVLEILSVALTNTPALDGLEALAELARKTSPTHVKEPLMTPEQIAALSQERDTLKTSHAALTAEVGTLKANVAALTTERDALKASVEAAAAEKAQAALAAEIKARDDLITAALGDGRLTPAQKPWAEKQPLASLTEFLGAAPQLPPGGGRQGGGESGGKAALTADEIAMCTRMSVSTEDYLKSKA